MNNFWLPLTFASFFLGFSFSTFAAAPTFVLEAETAWSTNTSPKTTSSFTVNAGDILVAFMIVESWDGTQTYSITDTKSSSWTNNQSVIVTSYIRIDLWTTTVATAGSMTVSFNHTAGNTLKYGGNVLVFRGSDGVGASSKTNVSSGAPSLNLTTTAANSAIVVASGDWNAMDGSTRTWRTGAGAMTEQTYFRDSSAYTVYGGYHADSGATGTYAVGLSAPGSQKYSIVAVEVKGTATAAKIRRRVISD